MEAVGTFIYKKTYCVDIREKPNQLFFFIKPPFNIYTARPLMAIVKQGCIENSVYVAFSCMTFVQYFKMLSHGHWYSVYYLHSIGWHLAIIWKMSSNWQCITCIQSIICKCVPEQQNATLQCFMRFVFAWWVVRVFQTVRERRELLTRNWERLHWQWWKN